jgi:hypothetical protein
MPQRVSSEDQYTIFKQLEGYKRLHCICLLDLLAAPKWAIPQILVRDNTLTT